MILPPLYFTRNVPLIEAMIETPPMMSGLQHAVRWPASVAMPPISIVAIKVTA